MYVRSQAPSLITYACAELHTYISAQITAAVCVIRVQGLKGRLPGIAIRRSPLCPSFRAAPYSVCIHIVLHAWGGDGHGWVHIKFIFHPVEGSCWCCCRCCSALVAVKRQMCNECHTDLTEYRICRVALPALAVPVSASAIATNFNERGIWKDLRCLTYPIVYLCRWQKTSYICLYVCIYIDTYVCMYVCQFVLIKICLVCFAVYTPQSVSAYLFANSWSL